MLLAPLRRLHINPLPLKPVGVQRTTKLINPPKLLKAKLWLFDKKFATVDTDNSIIPAVTRSLQNLGPYNVMLRTLETPDIDQYLLK